MIVLARTSTAVAGRASSGGSLVIGAVVGTPPPVVGAFGVGEPPPSAGSCSTSVTRPNAPAFRRLSFSARLIAAAPFAVSVSFAPLATSPDVLSSVLRVLPTCVLNAGWVPSDARQPLIVTVRLPCLSRSAPS